MPTIYEKRTYSVTVGQMPEVVRLYSTQGWPAMEAGGFAKNCVGYFIRWDPLESTCRHASLSIL